MTGDYMMGLWWGNDRVAVIGAIMLSDMIGDYMLRAMNRAVIGDYDGELHHAKL